jgi:hypothetical protein
MRRAIQKHTPPATKKRNIPYSYVFKMYRCEVFSQHLDIPAAGWRCQFRTYQFLFLRQISQSNLSFRVVPVNGICDKGCYSGPVPSSLAKGYADGGVEVPADFVVISYSSAL